MIIRVFGSMLVPYRLKFIFVELSVGILSCVNGGEESR